MIYGHGKVHAFKHNMNHGARYTAKRTRKACKMARWPQSVYFLHIDKCRLARFICVALRLNLLRCVRVPLSMVWMDPSVRVQAFGAKVLEKGNRKF